ncbi:hypothetical protein CRG98_016324 [Punica granatum]|uniref:Uncharacterized protein n=1 Tax=Punica granatum TaxID=22663 RepID=A0A2I0K411_PUNGR|nr:hypothetical protein CRG98_016324 [Punica granatum]
METPGTGACWFVWLERLAQADDDASSFREATRGDRGRLRSGVYLLRPGKENQTRLPVDVLEDGENGTSRRGRISRANPGVVGVGIIGEKSGFLLAEGKSSGFFFPSCELQESYGPEGSPRKIAKVKREMNKIVTLGSRTLRGLGIPKENGQVIYSNTIPHRLSCTTQLSKADSPSSTAGDKARNPSSSR